MDSAGQTIALLLRARRDANAAARFFRKALRAKHTAIPRVMTVEKHAAYPPAFETLQQEGQLPASWTLRQCTYCNNGVEQDHRCLTRRVNPGLGFGSFHTARRTLRGDEAMHMRRKGQSKGIAQGDVLAQHRGIAQVCGLAV